MMDDNLYRIESAVAATSSGDLTWDRWPIDAVIALGFSAQRNPIGFALVRYLGELPSSANVWGIVLALETKLIKDGVEAKAARDFSWRAFDFWRDIRCRSCQGRGASGASARECPSCGGSGQRPIPDDGHEVLRKAISILIEAEQWMEGQLRARLKASSYSSDSGEYRLHLPRLDGLQDAGINGAPEVRPRYVRED